MVNKDSEAIFAAADFLDAHNNHELADKLRDFEKRRAEKENTVFVVGMHKVHGNNKHEYKMSDGSIAVLGDTKALLSMAAGVRSVALKDAEIKKLRAELAATVTSNQREQT